MRVMTLFLVVLALGVQGCAAVTSGCSDVGGFDGVSVKIPRVLDVPSGSVTFEICDAGGCASATQRLVPGPEGPVGREVNVTFDELGRRFEPEQVTISVKLSDAKERVVAAARRDIELSRSYPNGKPCDGDGYLGGALQMTAADRL